ncbi:hypothetical protein [Pantoea ananatis]|uniref:hypothetical protein n=1 Tax=Pantoea ananas TaxID=553 RepID=UPI0025C7F77E|nr:hypothetical protein [Pantoea ananatis]MDN4129315.1 hypothetical protein [Pantoea ananatis]MDN4151644.1 hypothetical protein [Pantoea ananatis]
MAKNIGLALLIYIIFLILFTMIYAVSQHVTPEHFIVATPVISSVLLSGLYISFYMRRNKGKDRTKSMKPANDTLLFASAALVSFSAFSAEFSLHPFVKMHNFLEANPQIYLFIKLVLVTSAFLKVFIAIMETAREL